MEEAFAAYATPVGGRLLGSHVDGRVAPPVATLSELLTTHATHEWLLSCKVKSSGSRSRPRGQGQGHGVKVNVTGSRSRPRGQGQCYRVKVKATGSRSMLQGQGKYRRVSSILPRCCFDLHFGMLILAK